MTEDITKEKIDLLIKDVAYLKQEASALKNMIEEIPYDESPPGGLSVMGILSLIDRGQNTFYKPVFEQVFTATGPIDTADYKQDFESSFEFKNKDTLNIQDILDDLIKHREEFIKILKNIQLSDWNKTIYIDNSPKNIVYFLESMIHFERSKLKDIADRVMVIGQQRQTIREMENRRQQNQQLNNTDR